jgi:hypothetical protein
MPNLWTEASHHTDSPQFIEVVRRIPQAEACRIEDRMKEVSSEQLASLQAAIAAPSHLLKEDSFICTELFPYVAMKALRNNDISAHQFGTLMILWGRIQEVLPSTDEAEFIPLFLTNGTRNPHACGYLLACLQPSSVLPMLVKKTPEELLDDIYTQATSLSSLDQGFWLTKNKTDKSRHADYPARNLNQSVAEYLTSTTITQEIKANTDVQPLDFPAGHPQEIISSFGLQQAYLVAAFEHPVRINPVIAPSTVDDIRNGSLKRCRDVAVTFPGNELPKEADCFPAPSSLDYTAHDLYHCVRASRVTPAETESYVKIGDRLKIMQKCFDTAVKELRARSRIPSFYALQ